MNTNENLKFAKRNKNDEFYTQYCDIEAEIKHYRKCFRGKVIYCNCDNPKYSQFYRYFKNNFNRFGLKKLIVTYHKKGSKVYKIEMYPGVTLKKQMKGDGDFRNEECIELLRKCDIVVTNPPFSLFREYMALLIEHEKKFLIIGSMNAITYKEFFPLIKDGFVWPGFSFNKTMVFAMPESYKAKTNERDDMGRKLGKVPGICWFTNLDISKRHESLDLRGVYYKGNEDKYPHYDNYDAIEVSRVQDIPCDYDGVMGVPITFLDKHCPEQFEILGICSGRYEFDPSAWPVKRYTNAVQHNFDGSISYGGQVNRGPCILCNKTKYPHYTADNAKGCLRVVYARILIRKKL